MQPFIITKRERFSFVRLVDQDSKFHQSLSILEAENMAKRAKLDLVCFAPAEEKKAPLCKIIDYGKWKYAYEKTLKKEQHQKRKIIKEVQFSPVIDDGDIKHKVKQVGEFLEDGDDVILTMKFKNIQKRNFSIGEEKMNNIVNLCLLNGEIVNRKKTENMIIVKLKKK